MKIKLLALFLLISTFSFANIFRPNKAGDNGIFLTANNYDTIAIQGNQSPYAYIYLKTSGIASDYVVVINEGQVEFSVGNNGIEVDNCHYVKITGTGGGLPFGFYFHDKPGVGITIHNYSDHILLENFKVFNMTYAVWCKNESSCDAGLNYPNHPLHDIEIRNFDWSYLGQDVAYIGSTGGTAGRDVVCNGVTNHNVVASRLYNISIHDGVIFHANRTGIQVGGADSGVNNIHDIVINGMGYEFDPAQGAAVFLGADTKDCEVYNITAKNTWEHAIWSYGIGNVYVHDNSVDSTGILYGTRTYKRPGRPDTTWTGWHKIGEYNANNVFQVWRESPYYLSSFSNFRTKSINFIYKNNASGWSTDSSFDLIIDDPLNIINNNGNIVCNSGIVDNNSNASYSTTGCDTTIIVYNPVVTTSGDQTIAQPVTTASINGNATVSNGTIVSHVWSIVSGSGSITAAGNYSTTVTGLNVGQTVVRLTATSSSGGISSSDLTITVNSALNQRPIAFAGNDTSITLPQDTVQLQATGTDDHAIVSYRWRRISGGIKFDDKDISNPRLTFNAPGNYYVQVKVTDDSGAISVPDTIMITVIQDTVITPTIDAGLDITLFAPQTTTILNGSASQTATVKWMHISGGLYSIDNANILTPIVSNLQGGTHTFTLTGTSIDGISVTDTLILNVVDTLCNCGCSNGVIPNPNDILYGVNGNLLFSQMDYEDAVFRDSVGSIGMKLIRYPGGTVAETFDWQTGKSIYNIGNAYPVTQLPLIVNSAKVDIAFVLNMFTKNLDNQMQMLATAQGLGVPIKYVELGSEYNNKGDSARAKFPTPEVYRDTCIVWLTALRAAFPNAKFAAVGEDKNYAGAENWNDIVAGCNPDALTYHVYIDPDLFICADSLVDTSALHAAVVQDYRDAGMQDVTLPIWITEFNWDAEDKEGITDMPFSQRQQATYLIARYLAELNPIMELANNIIGKEGAVDATNNATLLPTGLALKQLINFSLQ